MNTLTSIKVFCQVVASGSFTKAADYLNISNAMASKHVSHLENTVQIRLLQRNSRNISLTEEGEIYHQHCLSALALLEQAAEQARSGQQTPQGQLKITAPIWCASTVFAQWIAEYQQNYPNVSIDLVLDNSMSDLIGEGIDIALRINDNLPPSLIARPLLDISFVFVATPTYLAQHGTPSEAKQLEQHAFVLPSYLDLSSFVYTSTNGNSEVLNLHTRSQSNNTVMLYELVKAGAGIGFLPTWLVQTDLNNGELTTLFADDFIHQRTLYAIYVSRQHLSAKIRSFIDFILKKAQHKHSQCDNVTRQFS